METSVIIFDYVAPNGRRPYVEWLRSLKDRQSVGYIRSRVERIRLGNFGDHRFVGDDVWELKIHHSPGFRIYYLQDGPSIVILLSGGDKSTQMRDIEKAKTYAADYWRRK